jgi:tripartite ATP-independent transporter DctP family solute receptor
MRSSHSTCITRAHAVEAVHALADVERRHAVDHSIGGEHPMKLELPAARAARRGVLAAAAAAAMLFALPSLAQTEIKLGHVGEPGSLFQKSADEFAKRANAKLGGKAKIVVYGSSQLGGDKEMIQKLKLGTLDMALPSTVMSSEVDLAGLFELPYIVKDREHMKRVEKDVFWPMIEPAIEKRGLTVLAVWENGFRQITNSKRPIKVPGDLAGIKLRVPEGKWRVKMFQAYGANPSPMKFSELFTALQTGVMDGEENPLTQIYSAKLQEVQKYLSMSGHVYTPAYLTVGTTHWKTLPADVRKVLEDTAKETQAFVYQVAAKDDEDLLGKLKQAGMQVNDVDKDAFLAASKSIYEEFAKEVPGAKAAIDKANSLR